MIQLYVFFLYIGMTQTVWRKKRKLSFLPCIKQKKKKGGGFLRFVCLSIAFFFCQSFLAWMKQPVSFLLLPAAPHLSCATAFSFFIITGPVASVEHHLFFFLLLWSHPPCNVNLLGNVSITFFILRTLVTHAALWEMGKPNRTIYSSVRGNCQC